MNKLVALNFISVFLFSLSYRSNRVIALGVISVFLFALGVCFVGSWRRPGAADVNGKINKNQMGGQLFGN